MATFQDVEDLIAQKLYNKAAEEGIDRDTLKASFQGMSDTEWDELLAHVNSRNVSGISRFILSKVRTYVTAQVALEATTIYSDQTLVHAEIERIFF